MQKLLPASLGTAKRLLKFYAKNVELLNVFFSFFSRLLYAKVYKYDILHELMGCGISLKIELPLVLTFNIEQLVLMVANKAASLCILVKCNKDMQLHPNWFCAMRL
jgi:hypothetical protein